MFKAIRLITFSLLTLSFVACQKEVSVENLNGTGGGSGSGSGGSTGGGGGTTTAALKMKINGTQWVADNSASATMLAGYLNIDGLSKSKKEISINVADTVVGVYNFDQHSDAYAELVDSTDPGMYTTYDGQDTTQAGGSLEITSVDALNKTISGTFHFKMYRDADRKKLVITEGSFTRLPYTSTLPPANSTDTLNVKIDGTLWSAKSLGAALASGKLTINAAELNLSKYVGISMPSVVTTGTYDFSTAGPYIGIYSPNTSTVMAAQTGNLTILENNTTTKRIRGNFNFTAISFVGTLSATLTEGYFSVQYQ